MRVIQIHVFCLDIEKRIIKVFSIEDLNCGIEGVGFLVKFEFSSQEPFCVLQVTIKRGWPWIYIESCTPFSNKLGGANVIKDYGMRGG